MATLAPRAAKNLLPIVSVILIAWVIALYAIWVLNSNCYAHVSHEEYGRAELPVTDACGKIFRWLWLSLWFEFPLVVGIACCVLGWLGSGYDLLGRFRVAWAALLAIATVQNMWAANVFLNLTDVVPPEFLSAGEVARARLASVAFSLIAALNILLIAAMGDEGPRDTGLPSVREPLLSAEGQPIA